MRLEALGFTHVLRYVDGKEDWLAHDLPRGGRAAEEVWAGDVAWRDVPTCRPDEPLGAVVPRVRAAGARVCVVVDEGRVVQGLLYGEALEAGLDTIVGEVMTCGPRTIRPNVHLGAAIKRMRDWDGKAVLVTTSDGVLIGLLRKDAARQARKRGRTGKGDTG